MSGETLSVLRALVAYLDNRLPPYTCSPHGPGHKEEWIGRANVLIEDGQEALQWDFRGYMKDQRKQFVYRNVLITPQLSLGLLGRTWKIHDLGGSVLVDTKERAKRVIDALID